jgi:hypothetical protein
LPNLTYEFRRSVAARTEEYSLTDSALDWSTGTAPFSDINAVRIYSIPGLQMLGAGQVVGTHQRCTIHCNSGKIIQLSSQHFLGPGKIEDRSQALIHFVNTLVAQVLATNPGALYLAGMPPVLWWTWFLAFGSLALALSLCIVFGLVGVTMEHQNSPGTFGIFLVLALMLIGPIMFLRATWRRRTRNLKSESISKAL